MRRECGSFSFEVPPSWKAQAMVLLGPPIDGARRPNIVLARGPRPPGESLEAFVWRTMCDASKQLEGVTVIGSEKMLVARRAAMQMRFRTADAQGVAEQMVIFVDAPGGDVLSVTCSIDSAPNATPAHEAWALALEHVAQTMLVTGASTGPSTDGPLVPMPGIRRP
jgi:hypothetical protein